MLRSNPPATLRCGNQLIELTQPVVMGIINVTPDSFYAPSRAGHSLQYVVEKAGEMLRDGAVILDIGGQSTRPGAEEISTEEELHRVLPVIRILHESFPEAVLSIDTYRSAVAAEAIQAGATMVNDISGGQLDPEMIDVVARTNVPYILMHMRGTPANMQQHAVYNDLIGEVMQYFIEKIRLLEAKGVSQIILDPGFGFAKTPSLNMEIMERLSVFRFLDKPILVGVSRKSTLSKITGRPSEETLDATTALHMAALERGAIILRTHDVRPARDAIAVFNELKGVKTLNNKRLSSS